MDFLCVALAWQTDFSGAERKFCVLKNTFENYLSCFFYIYTVLIIYFYLQLYLASDHKSFIRFAKKSYLQQVFLTDQLSYLTCWQAAFLDPQMRLEYEGFPVPVRN